LPCESLYESGVRAAQRRVLYEGQVQAALLARERRWLTVLSNLLAGPEANYGSTCHLAPPALGASPGGQGEKGTRECRA